MKIIIIFLQLVAAVLAIGTWTQIQPSNPGTLTQRYGLVGAYHASSNYFFTFGGTVTLLILLYLITGYQNDICIHGNLLSGSPTWQKSQNVVLSVRAFAAEAYDEQKSNLYIFGGYDGSNTSY